MVRFADKQKKYDQYTEDFQQAKVAIFAEYRGLTVAQLSELRSDLFKQKAKFTVVKNTIFKRTLKELNKEYLSEYFVGPIAVLMGFDDEIAPVKTLKSFLQKAKIGELKGGVLGDDKMTASQVKDLADLPPLDELRAKLLGAINSPLVGLVGCLNNPGRTLVYVLDQYGKTLESAG